VSQVRSVFRHALVFGMAPVLQKLIALLLLPYFTHYIDEEQYGLRDLLVAVTGFFPVLFTFEYRTGFLRSYVAAESALERARLTTATVLSMAVLAALAAGSFQLFWEPIFRFAEAPPVSDFFRGVLTAGIALDILVLALVSVLQAELWSGRMVTLNLVQFTLGVLLNVYFVVVEELGALGLFLGYTLSSSVYLLGLLWLTRGLFTRRLSLLEIPSICRPAFLYSLPLWGGAIAYFVVRHVERIVIPGASGLASLGVYGFAWKLSNMLVVFLVGPFKRSFDVWRFKVYEEGGAVEVITDSFRWFMLALGGAAVGVATFGIDLFLGLADPGFAGAATYLPWLNVAVLLQGAYTVTASALFVTARTGLWMTLFVIGAVLQVVLCWVLIPQLGPHGAAYAMIATNAFLYAGSEVLGRRLWPVPYRHGLALGVVALATALSFARASAPVEKLGSALLLDALLLAVFVAVAVGMRWVAVAELREGWRIVRERVVAKLRRLG